MARPVEDSHSVDDTDWRLALAVFAALRHASPRGSVTDPIRGEPSVIDGLFDPLRVGRALKRELQRAGLATARNTPAKPNEE